MCAIEQLVLWFKQLRNDCLMVWYYKKDPKLLEKGGKMLLALGRARTCNPEFSKKVTYKEQRSNSLGHGGIVSSNA